MAGTERVTVRDGWDREDLGQRWLGQRGSRLEMAWTEIVTVKYGLDREMVIVRDGLHRGRRSCG